MTTSNKHIISPKVDNYPDLSYPDTTERSVGGEYIYQHLIYKYIVWQVVNTE